MTRQVFKNPMQKLNEQYMLIDMKVKILHNSITNKLNESKVIFTKQVSKLDTLSPLKTLARGYSIVSLEKNGKIVNKAKALKVGDIINIRFIDGDKKAQISE